MMQSSGYTVLNKLSIQKQL